MTRQRAPTSKPLASTVNAILVQYRRLPSHHCNRACWVESAQASRRPIASGGPGPLPVGQRSLSGSPASHPRRPYRLSPAWSATWARRWHAPHERARHAQLPPPRIPVHPYWLLHHYPVLRSDTVGNSTDPADSACQVVSASGCWVLCPVRLALRPRHWHRRPCGTRFRTSSKGEHTAHPQGSAKISPTLQHRAVSPAAFAGVRSR
jgi:hypothetical protein